MDAKKRTKLEKKGWRVGSVNEFLNLSPIEAKGDNMREQKTWKEFRETGLLWWINRILHTFGWCITVQIDNDTQEVIKCYPERCSFRGFELDAEEHGYEKVTKYMKENADKLYMEMRYKVMEDR